MIEDAKEYLQSQLIKRKKQNPLLSMRSFAKYLGLSPAQLSQIISGKRPITHKAATKMIQALKLSPRESEEFLESIYPGRQSKRRETLSDEKRHILEEDEFRLICDWHHFAILSLCELEKNSSDARWISKVLAISLKDAAEARNRLLRMGLIQVKDKRLYQVSAPITTKNDIKSESIQRSHQQNLSLAMTKLDTIDVEEREFTTVTLATSIKKMKEAKKMIREFKRKLTDYLEDGEKTEVYTLAIQLFPLTQQRKK